MRKPVFAIYYPRGAVPEDGEALPQAAPPPEPAEPPPAAVPSAIAEAVNELLNAPLRAPSARAPAAHATPEKERVAPPQAPAAAEAGRAGAAPVPARAEPAGEAGPASRPGPVSGLAAGADLPTSPSPNPDVPPSAATRVPPDAAPSPEEAAARPPAADAPSADTPSAVTVGTPAPAAALPTDDMPSDDMPADDIPVAAVPAAARPGASATAASSALVIAPASDAATHEPAHAAPEPQPEPEAELAAEDAAPPEAPPEPAAPSASRPPSPPPAPPGRLVPEVQTASGGAVQGAHLDGIAHEVLGLFAPEVMTVRARVGVADWAGMGQPRAGLYRPEGFRPAPWNGLAYDVAPADGRGVGAGARVLTARGEVPVEELVPHDRVLGLRGPRLAEVAWIGRCSLPPATGDAAPVRVPAGALGEDQPAQDVIVGPDQTLFPDGATPVPARELVRAGAAEHAEGRETELFQVALRPYPGSEGGDVLLVEGIFAASRGAPDAGWEKGAASP